MTVMNVVTVVFGRESSAAGARCVAYVSLLISLAWSDDSPLHFAKPEGETSNS